MAYASRSGRARVSSRHPEAFGVCQRCGFWYQRRELQNQMEWRGAALLPIWLFVCQRCYDTPFEPDRAFIPPPDPVPIQLALPEDFSVATSVMGLTDPPAVDASTGIPVSPSTGMQTTDGVLMAPTPTGRPPGYDALDRSPVTPNDVVVFMSEADGTFMAEAGGTFMATEQKGDAMRAEPVPPLPDDGNRPPVQYGAPLPIVSLVADGTPLVRASTNGPHGLQLNSQVMVRGSLQSLADGVFSVIPITATVFTYGAYSPVPAGSILGQETIVVTTLVGLPRGFPALPQTGLPQSRPTRTSQ